MKNKKEYINWIRRHIDHNIGRCDSVKDREIGWCCFDCECIERTSRDNFNSDIEWVNLEKLRMDLYNKNQNPYIETKDTIHYDFSMTANYFHD